jgi:DNA-nicking Smr family endonuclease
VRGPRLSAEDAALWRNVTASIKPLSVRHSVPATIDVIAPHTGHRRALLVSHDKPVRSPVLPPRSVGVVPARQGSANTLDAGWDKKLAKGQVAPDFTIDLHGETQSSAHVRLNQSLGFAVQQGARLILLITGRAARDNPRLPPTSRGVIRASIEDWLYASSHHSRIAAIRPAHPRHGGGGALYLVMRR